jgi:hypothetical protein
MDAQPLSFQLSEILPVSPPVTHPSRLLCFSESVPALPLSRMGSLSTGILGIFALALTLTPPSDLIEEQRLFGYRSRVYQLAD